MADEKSLSADILKQYPLPDLNRLEKDYQEALKRFDAKVIAMDDDPTGVQTVHDISVYTDWSRKTFDDGFAEVNRLFFILTNSRSMTSNETKEVHSLMGARIADAAAEAGRSFILISRSDSTLRGHYPLETETLRETVEKRAPVRFDGEILYPFFLEGGRFTIGNVHYVREGDRLTPAGETEFAKDKTFGYTSSHLGEWVEEKSGGRYRKEDCIYISLEDLRALNYEKIKDQLLSASNFTKIIVNSIDYCDVKAFTVAFIDAVGMGKRYIIRSAAAITKVLGGVQDVPLLSRDRLIAPENKFGGIVIVGSHVNKTTKQLDVLKQAGLPITFIEFDVETAMIPGGLEKERDRIREIAEAEIRSGTTVAIYTSRKLLQLDTNDKEKQLAASVGISGALTGIVSGLDERPAFIIAKGGITSSDVGTKALKVHRATVAGQIKPGIPVWMTGEESKFPGMPYVIFPGNVGETTTLKEIVEELMGV